MTRILVKALDTLPKDVMDDSHHKRSIGKVIKEHVRRGKFLRIIFEDGTGWTCLDDEALIWVDRADV